MRRGLLAIQVEPSVIGGFILSSTTVGDYYSSMSTQIWRLRHFNRLLNFRRSSSFLKIFASPSGKFPTKNGKPTPSIREFHPRFDKVRYAASR